MTATMFKKRVAIQEYDCHECRCRTSNVDRCEDTGGVYCGYCGGTVSTAEYYRDPAYVSIAVYEVTQAYGGPEEGGWWYDHFTLSMDHVALIRNFDDMDEAAAYHDELKRLVEDGEDPDWEYPFNEPGKGNNYRSAAPRFPCYRVKVFSEQMAPSHMPTTKPRYG